MITVPESAYQQDATFRAIVDHLESMLHGAQLSPYEVRAAAMLAVIHYELRRPFSARLVQREDGTFDLLEEK